jgi:hypothetical protein
MLRLVSRTGRLRRTGELLWKTTGINQVSSLHLACQKRRGGKGNKQAGHNWNDGLMGELVLNKVEGKEFFTIKNALLPPLPPIFQHSIVPF